jgi:hypothetical protein
MAAPAQREHYIPLRQADIVELLAGGLPEDDAGKLRQLATFLGATFHFEYHRYLEALEETYAPFDPDTVTRPLKPISAANRSEMINDFFERFQGLMERANFKHLDKAAIIEATKAVSDWGINMDVDFDLFERLDIYYRGDTVGQRTRRRWYRFFRLESIELPVFERMVLAVKLKPSKRLPPEVDTDDIFIKLFKEIPKMDVEMLLPGARMVMPGFTRLKMGGSLISGLAYLVYTVVKQVILAGVVLSVYVFWGPLLALMGYGYRQWYGYQTTKNAFALQLTQSLYYQTLGNNLGVIQHLLDEAEEQECREAVLAYHELLKNAPPEGLTSEEIDAAVESLLRERAGVEADFEVSDALAKLRRLRLVEEQEGRYRAVTLDEALVRLDEAWDGYFTFHNERAAPAGTLTQAT